MTTRSAHFALGAAALLSLLLNACGSEAPSPPSAQDIQDDFSQEFCRFGSMGGSTSRGYGCIDGEFRAWIDNDEAPYDFIAASAGESMGDVRLEVDVRFAQDAEGGAYLICRGSQAGGSFYLLRLAAEGWVEITDFLDGEEQTAHMIDSPGRCFEARLEPPARGLHWPRPVHVPQR